MTGADKLLAWYRANKRALPFRDCGDPYRIWVSEIMAQQTRIGAVLPYFERFIEKFSTIQDLAGAPLDEVLKMWEGLGYYSRARNLHAAARVIVDELDGKLPGTYEKLRKLPGIGDYTAGAIASIAFGEKASAVDGNVRRVFARLFAPTTRTPGDWILSMMEESPPGDVTQAVMELGALACIPKAPRCLSCPLSEDCYACQTGDFPEVAPRKAQRVERREVWLIVTPEGKVMVRRRDEKLLHGLWEFPPREYGPEEKAQPVGRASHTFTHIRWEMEYFLKTVPEFPPPVGCRWVFTHELDTLTIPVAMQYGKIFLKRF